MKRKLRYSVAASLDGFIAGPNGEYDWIPMDPEIDFQEMISQYDTAIMGRNTFVPLVENGDLHLSGLEIFVISKTLKRDDYPDVQIVSEQVVEFVTDLKSNEGKDIWLFGGGELFQSLATEGLVDEVEVAVIPVILGEGIPLSAVSKAAIQLTLLEQRVYQNSGITKLLYQTKPG